MRNERHRPSRLIGEVTALLIIGALVSGLGWLWWWWATPGASGQTDIITGEVMNIVIEPGGKWGNRVRMLVNAEGHTQIGLSDRTSGFLGCKVGSDIKMRRIKTATGFVSYKFIPGSCSSKKSKRVERT